MNVNAAVAEDGGAGCCNWRSDADNGCRVKVQSRVQGRPFDRGRHGVPYVAMVSVHPRSLYPGRDRHRMKADF